MKLSQISTSDKLSQLVVAKMMETAPILQYAEFYSQSGNADSKRKASAASGGQFRGLNVDYPDNKVNPTYATPTLKILGDKVEVDRAYERRGLDVSSVRARDLLAMSEKIGYQFQNYFVNGDTAVSVDQFNGIKKITPAGQKITAAQNGFAVSLGNSDAAKVSQQKFKVFVKKLISKVIGGAQFLLMDGDTISILTEIADEQCTTLKGDFGKPISFFNGIPLIDSGYDKAGAKVITLTEECGTSGAVCTSIYAGRFGEATNLSIMTNIGVDVKDLGIVGVHYTHQIDLDADLLLENDKAIARLEGIIIS